MLVDATGLDGPGWARSAASGSPWHQARGRTRYIERSMAADLFRTFVTVTVVLAMLMTSCSPRSEPEIATPTTSPRPQASTPKELPEPKAESLLVASSFERPICGTFHDPGPGCEFGFQSEVVQDPSDSRTGRHSVRMQRLLQPGQHVHIGGDISLPGGHGFVGAAHRTAKLPVAEGDFIQLMQVTPASKALAARVVEVRIYSDRRLGLGLFEGSTVARTTWRAPRDTWFFLVIEISHGVDAVQRLWIYEEGHDRPVERLSLRLDTTGGPCCRIRQALGGTESTVAPAYTYVDDFYVATENLGPLRISSDGSPIE